MTVQLSNCPFCGQPVEVYSREATLDCGSKLEYTVGCNTEDCWCYKLESNWWFNTAEEATQKWHSSSKLTSSNPAIGLVFGDYVLDVNGNHLVIYHKDSERISPTFYEMFYMKCLAFGGRAVAVEVFPDVRELVDGEHQRHLFKIEKDSVPNLLTGKGIKHEDI